MDLRRITRSVLALSTGLALAAGTASAAHADSFRHHDATGDVFVTTRGAPGESRFDPSQTLPDLQSFTVLHSRWTLSVATALRGLEGSGNTWIATIVTSKGDHIKVIRGGRVYERGTASSYEIVRNGNRLKCDGFRVSRTSTGVIAKVPTRCLGNPWKVRVGVQAHTRLGGGPPLQTGHDDVLRNGAFTYYEPALSPWIAR